MPLQSLYDLVRATLQGKIGRAHADGHHWHASHRSEVVERLRTDRATGLTDSAAERRRQRHGGNIIKTTPPRSVLSIFAGQFASLPVAVLAGAALLFPGPRVPLPAGAP